MSQVLNMEHIKVTPKVSLPCFVVHLDQFLQKKTIASAMITLLSQLCSTQITLFFYPFDINKDNRCNKNSFLTFAVNLLQNHKGYALCGGYLHATSPCFGRFFCFHLNVSPQLMLDFSLSQLLDLCFRARLSNMNSRL